MLLKPMRATPFCVVKTSKHEFAFEMNFLFKTTFQMHSTSITQPRNSRLVNKEMTLPKMHSVIFECYSTISFVRERLLTSGLYKPELSARQFYSS